VAATTILVVCWTASQNSNGNDDNKDTNAQRATMTT
jgi:hypothetical protein